MSKVRNQSQRNRSNKPRRGVEGPKDSDTKRINLDNARIDKVKKDLKSIEGTADSTKRKTTDNDISWYSRTPALLESAGRYSFYNVTGDILPVDGNSPTTQQFAVPGVCALRYCPSLGALRTNALKQAQDSMLSYIVHANSRNQSYDGADIMVLVLAGIECFSAIATGIRAYGTMQIYDQTNKYLPDALLKATGFDAADLRANYSHMWFDLNRLIAASRQIWVPNTMPLMERRYWLNTNYYMDGTSIKSQIYVFKPAYFYQYNSTIDNVGGGLERVSGWTPQSNLTWSQYVNMVDSMINALVNDTDRGLIFGDILKAYGSDALYRIDDLPQSYVTPISYNQEVLTQIENATTCGYYPTSFNQQPDGTLYAKYTGTSAIGNVNNGAPNKVLINFHQKEQPTPEQIMIATRLTACETTWVNGTVSGSSAIVAGQPTTCGSEYVASTAFYAYTKTGTGAIELSETINSLKTTSNTVSTSFIMQWSAFDWAPHFYCMNVNSTLAGQDDEFLPGYVLADYENYTFMTASDLDRLHTAAIFSEFGVPINVAYVSKYESR